MPLFYMSLLKAHKGVISELERWQRLFLWGGSSTKRAICEVNWKMVCNPKNKGGLGIKSLSLVNKSLLSKWWWRFAVEKNSFGRRVICCKFGWDPRQWDLGKLEDHITPGLTSHIKSLA